MKSCNKGSFTVLRRIHDHEYLWLWCFFFYLWWLRWCRLRCCFNFLDRFLRSFLFLFLLYLLFLFFNHNFLASFFHCHRCRRFCFLLFCYNESWNLLEDEENRARYKSRPEFRRCFTYLFGSRKLCEILWNIVKSLLYIINTIFF